MASNSVRLTRTGVIFIATGLTGIFLYSVGLPLAYRFFEQKVDMRSLLSACIDVARKGGERVREIRENPDRIKQKVKGETLEGAKELLTAADLESHRIMHGALSKAFPKIKIISEEHDDTNSDTFNPEMFLPELASVDPGESIPLSDITIWIDPLDATQEYTENLTQYVTTMVCVAVKGKPIIGVVHQPFTRETTWGFVNHGISKNLKSVTKRKKVSELRQIIVSRSHAGDVEEFIKSSKSFGQNVQIIPAGGAGYKVLQVLQGKADAYVHVTAIKKWDICAGNALMSAMEGKMTTLKDEEIGYSADVDRVKNLNGLLVTYDLSRDQHDTFVSEFSSWMLTRKIKTHRKTR